MHFSSLFNCIFSKEIWSISNSVLNNSLSASLSVRPLIATKTAVHEDERVCCLSLFVFPHYAFYFLHHSILNFFHFSFFFPHLAACFFIWMSHAVYKKHWRTNGCAALCKTLSRQVVYRMKSGDVEGLRMKCVSDVLRQGRQNDKSFKSINTLKET